MQDSVRTTEPWRTPCAVLALYLGALIAAAALLPCPAAKTHGMRLALCLLAIEVAGLAVAAPFLAARARLAWTASTLAAMAYASVVIIALAARGSAPLAGLLWSHIFLLAFAWVLVALTTLLVRLRFRPTTSQAVATAVALLMLGQVFFANGLIEAAASERGKMLAIDAVLWTNPWLIVGGSILQADPLRSQDLYEWSVIIYYGFRYPGATIASAWVRTLFLTGIYAGCALLLHGAAWRLAPSTRRTAAVQAVDNNCPDL